MDNSRFIVEQDREEYRAFCANHLPRFRRASPSEIWHYTDAKGLVGILQTGKIWSTQITCLNDNFEHRYFGDLVHEAVRSERAKNADPSLNVLLTTADRTLAERDYSAQGFFVACFSEVE